MSSDQNPYDIPLYKFVNKDPPLYKFVNKDPYIGRL